MTAPLNVTGTTPAPSPIIVTINKAQFEAAVQQYLDLSPVKAELTVVKSLAWPKCCVPPALWTTMADLEQLIAISASACELAKVAILKQYDPSNLLGSKVDNEIVVAVAVNIVGAAITFTGVLGFLVEQVKEELLRMLISMWVDQKPTDWLVIAEEILGITL
jgi:hypothetical protein